MDSKAVSNILDLPYDVLLHICSYLSSIDIVVISQVNRRFNEFCCEKCVVRNLNFKDAYRLTRLMLRAFFIPKFRCENIIVLNLNYCHWLPSEAFTQIQKMRNLKELHILDCQVSFTNLKKIILAIDLRALSWTWHVENVRMKDSKYYADFGDRLTLLQRLVLHLSDFRRVLEIYYFLNCCSGLESFELLFVNTSNKKYDHYDILLSDLLHTDSDTFKPTPLKQLKYLKVKGVERFCYDMKTVFKLCACSATPWDCLWIADGGLNVLSKWLMKNQLTLSQIASANALNLSDATRFSLSSDDELFLGEAERNIWLEVWNHVGPMQCRELSLNNSMMTADLLNAVAQRCLNLEKLSMANCDWEDDEDGEGKLVNSALKLLVDNCLKLTHLDITRAEDARVDISCLTSLKYLVSLGISPNMLSKMKPVDRQDRNSGSRVGLQTNLTEGMLMDTVLWAITEACPHIAKLQILIRKVGHFGTHAVAEAEYACISRLQKLTHLHIQDSSYRGSGHFLMDVLKNCTGLVSLRLGELGNGGRCIHELSCALPHAKSLRNLSIMQEYINLPSTFFTNLAECGQLERLELSHVGMRPELSLHIESLVTKLTNLIVLYLWTEATNTVRKNIEIMLKKFVNERPAFSYFIWVGSKHSEHENPSLVFRDGFHNF